MVQFDPNILKGEDRHIALGILQTYDRLSRPDLLISPHDKPYIYRWHLVRQKECSIYFHVQVCDDTGRELHDHPWDNYSVILAGGYTETFCSRHGKPDPGYIKKFLRKPGDVIYRGAEQAHRLDLAPGQKYSMSLFTCGPKKRGWGFWVNDKFVPFESVTELVDGVSRHKEG